MLGYLETGRVVWTYAPDGVVPVGLITGYEYGQKSLMVEHIVVCPPATPGRLCRVLRAGLADAWAAQYETITLSIPYTAPSTLGKLAQRMGFTIYDTSDLMSYWVRYGCLA